MEYEWSQPISTKEIDVYWWDDRRGVRLPKACRLLYWDGTEMVSVSNASGLGVNGDQYNRTAFDEVRTSRLRLEIDSNGEFSTGVLEWKVYDSGDSPDFPPRVEAGVDRVVMLAGKTYLSGAIRTLAGKGAAPTLTWSKASGPGTVTFEDSGAAVCAPFPGPPSSDNSPPWALTENVQHTAARNRGPERNFFFVAVTIILAKFPNMTYQANLRNTGAL